MTCPAQIAEHARRLRPGKQTEETRMAKRSRRPFWKQKTLEEMSRAEWEALCDGCGRCCLLKLEDEDTDEIVYTRVACRLLDISTCQCSNYARRRKYVPDCVQLTEETAYTLPWLPETCAYRLVALGQDLEWWHPLVAGSAGAVHEAGVSVRAYAVSEEMVEDGGMERYLLKWVD
jgi:uncharacterized cysteine cluster protein YcgN (CxxCxxCC family)